jgi:phage tail-like protein
MAQSDPFRSYNFKLEINGLVEGHFTECSGLSVKTEAIAYHEPSNNQVVGHVPGPVDHATVTLKYGVTKSHELGDWIMKASQGNVERRNVSIVVQDSQGDNEAMMRWNLLDAWPSEWQWAGLNATDKSVVIESLTLVYDSLERAG